MSNNKPTGKTELEDYREYLRLLVELQMDERLQGKIDPSGIVQQTMLEAHQALPQFEDQTGEQLVGWLRRILANNLLDEVRKLRTGKRDLKRERSLDAALEHSSKQILGWVAANQPSPSWPLQQQETAMQLAAALGKLPPAQREALILRHLQGKSLAEISEQMDRTHSAVAGLLKRGLQHLREQLRDWS